MQHGGERRRTVVQRDLRLGGETARLAVERVGDAASRGRQMLCAQHLAEGALAPRDDNVAVAQDRVAVWNIVVDEDACRDRLFLSVECDGVAVRCADDFAEMEFRLRAVLARNELDAAVVVNGGVKPRTLTVDCDLCECSHRAGEAAPFTVHGNHEPHAGATVVFPEADAGREQCVGDIEFAEVKEAVLDIVDPDGEEVQGVDGSDLQDAERCDRIGGVEFFGQLRNAVHLIRLTHGDACLGNAECTRHKLRHHGRERTAADQHNRLWRFSVQIQNLLCNRRCKVLDPGLDRGENLIGSECELHAEDVRERDILSVRRLALDVLGDVEVEQVLTRDRLRDLIARHWHHAIGDDRAAARDGDIGRACADVHEDEVEVTHCGGDEDIDARNRFEGERAHLKMCFAQRRLHGVDDLTREEGGDDRRLCVSAALPDEGFELVAVELVADCAVADAVVARRIIHCMRVGELPLCCLDTRKVKIALLCGRDRTRDLLLRLRRHRVECTSCGSHGGTAECARTLGEAAFDLANDGGDLGNIVNLAVEHGSRLVLHAFRGEDVEKTIPLFGDDTDDAACADVERKDQLCRPLTARCDLRGSGFPLLWTTALLGGSVLRIFLYAFFGAAALFGRGGVHFFVRFIRIRHVDLP